MNVLIKYLCFSTLLVVCYSKDLHIKEEPQTKDNGLRDIFKNSDLFLAGQKRPARHVEIVTETVLQHLINEINRKYPDTRAGGKNSTMPKLIRKLKSKLRRQMKKNKNLKRKKTHSQKTSQTQAQNLETTTSNFVNINLV